MRSDQTGQEIRKIKVPLTNASARELKADDYVYLFGTVYTVPQPERELSSADYTAAECNSIAADFKSSYTNIVILGPATRKYNCHSYACYKRTTSNIYWVDTAPTGCGFTRRNTAINGGAIYYSSGSPHSGVVHGTSGGDAVLVKSKWGKGPLIQHGVLNSPYGSSVLYYD